MVLDHEFPPDNRVEKEARSLTEEGHKLYIACFTEEGKPFWEIINGYTIIRKPISGLRKKTSVGVLKFPFYFNFWRKFLDSILKQEHFDAIHIHDLPLAQVGLEMRKKYNLKFILDLHENWPAHLRTAKHTNTFLGKLLSSNKQWDYYEQKMTRTADAVITVVQEMNERLVKLGVNRNKLFVLQNFIELNKSRLGINYEHKISQNKEEYILIYSGGVTFHRGLQIAIKGLKLARVKKNKIKLWVVGDGSYLPFIKQLVNQEGLQNIVKFTGRKPYEELLEYIEHADIGIIPHLKTVQTDNSSPNKLFEYMSKGLPILSSNCNSVGRLIKESDCGKIYKHDSPEDFAKKLLQMIHSKEDIKNYSYNAKKAVKEKFNWETSKKNLFKLYKTI